MSSFATTCALWSAAIFGVNILILCVRFYIERSPSRFNLFIKGVIFHVGATALFLGTNSDGISFHKMDILLAVVIVVILIVFISFWAWPTFISIFSSLEKVDAELKAQEKESPRHGEPDKPDFD